MTILLSDTRKGVILRGLFYFTSICFAAIMSSHSNDNNQGIVDPKLAIEALVGEIQRMMKTELDLIHERLDWVENINYGRERALHREDVFNKFY